VFLFYAGMIVCAFAVRPLECNDGVHKYETNSQQKNTDTKPTGAVVHQSESAKPNTRTSQQTPETQPKPMRITEPLPNDTWYKTYVAATVLLAFFGLLGVGVAYKTLKWVQSQAVIMRGQLELMQGQLETLKEQTKAIKASVEVAKKGADLAWRAFSVSRRAHLLVEGWDYYFIGTKLEEVELRFWIFNPTENVAQIDCCSIRVTEECGMDNVDGITIGPGGRQRVEVSAEQMNWLASLQERDSYQEVEIKGTIIFSSDVVKSHSLDFGVTCIRRGAEGEVVEFVGAYNREESQDYEA